MSKVELRLPKGTRDYVGLEYLRMEALQNTVRDVFAIHSPTYLETPTFELTNVLMNKYGEDEKLIYNLESSTKPKTTQDGKEEADDSTGENAEKGEATHADSMFKERLSLRYDLTVPLVRYCIQNGIAKMRRASIGKVYRRETTSASNKRLREFYQADFDFVGDFEELLPELSIFAMIQDLMRRLNLPNYEIIYNYRESLDLCAQMAGIDSSLFSTVCSSIDKLDKHDRSYVEEEMMGKGLTADQVKTLFDAIDANTMTESTREFNTRLIESVNAMSNIDRSKLRLDSTLARGSDYYTGIIFEVKLTGSEFSSSIAGGGRYDKLIPSYLPPPKVTRKQRKAGITKVEASFPMIGFSFGLDRVLQFLPDDVITRDARPIWIGTIGKVDQNVKLRFVSEFQAANICVLYNLKSRKFTKEIQDAEGANCSHVLIIGEQEYAESKFKLKNMDKRTEEFYSFDEIDEVIRIVSA